MSAVTPIRQTVEPPAGLDVERAVAAAFDLAAAYRQAELAGASDIDRSTVFALAERHGADAVQYALKVSARRALDEAAALREGAPE